MQVGAQALRKREHPLPDGQVRQDVTGQVGGDLRHAARVAGGAGAAPLTGERHEPRVTTIHAAGPREAVGRDTAVQVGSEVTLDPGRDPEARGIRLLRARQEGLRVVLDDRIERRRRRTPRAVDGACGMVRGRSGAGRQAASRVRKSRGAGSHALKLILEDFV